MYLQSLVFSNLYYQGVKNNHHKVFKHEKTENQIQTCITTNSNSS